MEKEKKVYIVVVPALYNGQTKFKYKSKRIANCVAHAFNSYGIRGTFVYEQQENRK